MINYLSLLLSVLCLMWADPCHGEARLSEILEGIRNNYGTQAGLTVKYEREIITKSMALMGDAVKSDPASGQLHYMPPYFLRVEQEAPNREILTTDGKTLWWYIAEKNQVHRYPTENLGPELRLLSDVFRGLKGVEEGFVVSLKEEGDGKSIKLELLPNPPWPDISRIDLHVTAPDCTLEKVEIYNIMGGLTRFKLDPTINQGNFKEEFFRFRIPEGARVIEN
ncbi:MAG: outer membrane lipoprotein carrier protein LolA [Deltaproteobacteria bacterium]|nr:outer membrane lipoprotein carrier protein LolA [Deltaproteobacteria bacterium]